MAKYGPGRMLRTSFFQSADLMDLPDWASRLWTSIFVHADDDGIIRADPGYLRGLTWPHGPQKGPLGGVRPPTKHMLSACLGVFVGRGMLSACARDAPGVCSACNGDSVTHYHITNFSKHQDMTWRDTSRNTSRKGIEGNQLKGIERNQGGARHGQLAEAAAGRAGEPKNGNHPPRLPPPPTEDEVREFERKQADMKRRLAELQARENTK